MSDRSDITGNTSRLICLGIISTAHGIRGEVKVRSFTSVPEDITAYGPLKDKRGKAYDLTITACTKDVLIARIKGVSSRNEAEMLRNTELFVHRDALPPPHENEYYYEDLTGLKLLTEDGRTWGTLLQMHNFGAGDLASVRRETGQEDFLPFTKEIFTRIDFKKGICVIHPPEIEEPGADAPKDSQNE